MPLAAAFDACDPRHRTGDIGGHRCTRANGNYPPARQPVQ